MARTAGKRIDETKLAAALSNLNRRIEAGEEYPDASWSVSCQYNVPYEALQDAYDDQFSKGN